MSSSVSHNVSTAALRDEIQSAMAEAGLSKIKPGILSQCVALASTLHVSPKQMAECWEAYSLNKNQSDLTDHSFPAYRLALIKDSDTSGISTSELLAATGGRVGAVQAGKRSDSGLATVTPPAKRFHAGLQDGSSASATAAAATSSSGRSGRVSLSPGPPVSLQSRSAMTPAPKYSERTNAGKVLLTYNPNKLEATPSAQISSSAQKTPRCVVSPDAFAANNVDKPYRHLFTTLEERARVLDNQLVEMQDVMAEHYGLRALDYGAENEADNAEKESDDIAPLEAVGVARQDKICCVGRICNAAHEGRINATSILLEGTRFASSGARPEVDLSDMKSSKASFSLFPGQIVAVEGINISGRKMVASRICEGAAPEAPKSSVQELLRFHHDDANQAGMPLKIMTACGPYTTSDSLEFEPLLDLMNIVNTEKPDVVILCGPFVDLRQPAVRSGQVTLQFEDGVETVVPYESFFANKVAGLLEDLFSSEEDLQTQFVLVPSLDDATAEWVYPQAPFTDRLNRAKNLTIPGGEGIEAGSLGLHHIETVGRDSVGHRRVHRVSNPCTLKINELVVGVTSTDVLFHIGADETNANLPPGSRLERISQHLIQQRSYYPLFPAAPMMNMDLKKMDQWKMPIRPDLLILPSKLTSFARTVLDSTVVVNPGHLSRDTVGGSYATMEVHPIKRETLENAGGDDVEMLHSAQERTIVEIKRI